MAVAATKVTAYTEGNKRVKVFDLVFSGNYATGGESITNTTFGLKRIEQVIPNGNCALSTDLATANPVGIKVNSTGTAVTVTQYEGAASGAAIGEKTNSEVYATGSNIRVTVIGF